MRPTPANASAAAATFWHWKSPLPYLFAGLALMLVLIASALIILACSYRKRSSSQSPPDHDGEKSVHTPAAASAADNTPKIVVIMAGEDNPTHLAVPLPSSFPTCTCVCERTDDQS